MTDYLYPDCGHDYDFEWDHILDEDVTPEDRQLVDKICAHLRAELLPQLGVFKDFQVALVTDESMDEMLSKYASGTYSQPCIALCLPTHHKGCAEYDVDLEIGISTSIVYGLGLALQEALGLSLNSKSAHKHADELAQHWEAGREVGPFFEKKIAKLKKAS